MIERLRRNARAGSLAGALALAVATAGCDLDVTNPNAPTRDQVLNSVDGLIALAIGMQDEFAANVDDFVLAPALVTDEWGTSTSSLSSYRDLFLGNQLLPDFGVVEAPFAATYRVVRDADELLNGIQTVSGVGPGLGAGLEALARLHRAMALGYAIMQYEEIPIDVSGDDPVPVARDLVLDEILSQLETARAVWTGTSEDALSGFNTRVKGSGLEMLNTIDAMLARYYLLDGQYQAAIDAAARVDLNDLSTVVFVSPDANPVWGEMQALNYVKPLESFRATAEAGDERIDFWIAAGAVPFPGNPPDTLLLEPGQYATQGDPFPIYLPDEMRLIQAEAHARMGNFAQARDLVNEVRTQSSSPVEEPIANLPPMTADQLDTEEELLDQIAYERHYELFLQGLRWEDARRLGFARTVDPTFMWLPLPSQECQTNENACAT